MVVGEEASQASAVVLPLLLTAAAATTTTTTSLPAHLLPPPQQPPTPAQAQEWANPVRSRVRPPQNAVLTNQLVDLFMLQLGVLIVILWLLPSGEKTMKARLFVMRELFFFREVSVR